MGRRYFCIQWWLLGTAALMLSCGSPAQPRIQEIPANRLLLSIPHQRYADDVARFLAGLPAQPGSPFAQFEDNAAWAIHRRELDAAWSGIERQRLPAMRAFQQSELGGQTTARAPVFYPFSGPDVLTVSVFFPQSPVYVMVGLEPVGTLPAPKQFESKNLDIYLAATRSGLDSEMVRSFFITRQMDREFRGQTTDGLCLPILELLVRSHYTVLGFRYVRINDDGQVVERDADYHAPGKIWNKGVEIEFRSDTDHSSHKLFYFSVNLDDEHLRQDRPFLTFLSTLRGATTFLKATSYMVHHSDFSIIREQVLSQSAAVLQDDSGVPYHFYASPTWRVQLYGQYVRPYGSFRWLEQTDLRNAYLTQGPKPLQFRISYGFHVIPSNLLLATKLK